MLHGMYTEMTTQSLIEQLNRSKFDFYLTGSRYFGNSHENSDYDFLVEDQPGVQAFLVDLGFCLLSQSSYLDCSTHVVFRANVRPWIDVQIIKPGMLDFKLKVQQVLYEQPNFTALNKWAQRLVWDTALKMCM